MSRALLRQSPKGPTICGERTERSEPDRVQRLGEMEARRLSGKPPGRRGFFSAPAPKSPTYGAGVKAAPQASEFATCQKISICQSALATGAADPRKNSSCASPSLNGTVKWQSSIELRI